MRKKNTALVLLVITLMPMVVVAPLTTRVKAWGLSTHMFMVSTAIEQMSNATWRRVFQFYTPELLSGATTPDQVWQDWDNHLYYPETGEHNAPWAAQKWFGFARANFSAGNWEDGFFAAGVVSHYFSDPCIPVHTGEYWPGHTGYETEINEKLQFMTLGPYEESTIDNVTELVIQCATYSHQYFDTIHDAYEDESSRALTNSTVLTITEDCLTMALSGCLSLFYTLTQGIEPPDVEVTYDYVALFDCAHSNDYVVDKLNSVNQTLARLHVEMRRQETPITADALSGVDLLVMTCALDAYTSAELSAIADWASSGDHAVLLCGRGDYSEEQDIARPNHVLEAIGSHIRFNDDNIYMLGTHQPWYNDLYDIPAPEATLGLTDLVFSMTMFSPASLYFTDEGPVLPVIFADNSAYQTDQNAPAPVVYYDMSDDGANGEQIPLLAVEEVGNLRVIVAGTTFFSDYDYGKSAFDNVKLFEDLVEWAVGDRAERPVPAEDEMGPRFTELSWKSTEAANGHDVVFSVRVLDASGVENVTLSYSLNGTEHTLVLTGSGDVFNVTVPAMDNTALDLTLIAYDTHGNRAVFTPLHVAWTAQTETPTGTGQVPPVTLIAVAGIAVVAVLALAVVWMRRRH